ncbi:J-domain-containing protein [Peribacillus deserti]|uniref:DUF1992 domain-containing protein n=1 Tax=Peribacillus deserti TaxID=673318 RepID=A0A2N5M394_9BACI|nr:DUF1992 domain-containing protein [Peribacillus deserti]PLT28827.1 DUF1992 domain-containing protein [Peribacillus deserti]
MKNRNENMDSERAKRIAMGDQSTSQFNWYYEDHITSIVRRAEREGQFDLIKGKDLVLDPDMAYNPDKQFNKVLKDNGILPRWVELSREIDHLKQELRMFDDRYNIERSVKMINKKVMDYNLGCPSTAQKSGIRLEDYLRDKGL